MDVDTRLLRYFLAVADELNFTRAAERLYVSQPALSKAINRLESDLRLPLFDRNRREVRLTAAGRTLAPLARTLLRDWDDSLAAARTAAADEARVLRIGFVATGAGQLMARARSVFSERYPVVKIEPRRYDWAGEVPALRQGEVDVAFVWLPTDLTGLDWQPVSAQRRLAGLAVGHPLTERPTLSIVDLTGEPIVRSPTAPREWVDWWAVNPRPDGSTPIWGPENDNPEEMLDHVAAGAAICIVPASMAEYYARPDIAWREISDVEPLRIVVATRSGARSRVADAFVAVVRELAETNELTR